MPMAGFAHRQRQVRERWAGVRGVRTSRRWCLPHTLRSWCRTRTRLRVCVRRCVRKHGALCRQLTTTLRRRNKAPTLSRAYVQVQECVTHPERLAVVSPVGRQPAVRVQAQAQSSCSRRMSRLARTWPQRLAPALDRGPRAGPVTLEGATRSALGKTGDTAG